MRIFPMVRVCLSVFIVSTSYSNTARAEWYEISTNYYLAGLPSDQLEYYASPEVAGRQRQANWCWAATIQMVLNWHGLYITQEEIVQRVFGYQIDQPASLEQVLAGLSGWAPDTSGGYSTVHASYYPNMQDIVQDLAYRWPLIAGLQGEPIGHAYVLTGVYYSVDAYNHPTIDRVILRDPWPGVASRQEMPWHEFLSRAMWVVRVHVERQ